MKSTRPLTSLLLLAVAISVTSLAFGEPIEVGLGLANDPEWVSAFPSTNFTVVGDGVQLINEVLNGNVDSIFLGASTMTLLYPTTLIVPKRRLVSVHAGSSSSRTTVFIKEAVFKVYGRVLFQNIDFVHSGEFVRYGFPHGHVHFSNCSFRLSQACSDGWVEKIPGQCIKIMSTPQTWEGAFETCKELGSQLLTVQTVLDHMAGPYEISHWIGARRNFARFRQYRKLGWRPLYQTHQWCDFTNPLFLQPDAPLVDVTDMLDCMAIQYFALRPSDCEELKPCICAKPRLSPRISNRDMLMTFANNTFIPNSLFDFYHALDNRSLPADFGKIRLPRSNPLRFISAAFPETIEIALTMTTDISEVQIALDSVPQPNPPGVFSFHEAPRLPTHVHVHTPLESCIGSMSVMFLDQPVFSFQAIDYQHCDLAKHVIAFNSTCIRFNTDFTVDLTKLGTCDAVMSLWQHSAIGGSYTLLVVTPSPGPIVQARHDGIFGVRNFEINGSLTLDGLKDIRQLPDKLFVSSDPQCLIAIGILKDDVSRVIRYGILAIGNGCDSSPCFPYLTNFCLDYEAVENVEVNLLSESPDNACFVIETITPRQGVPLACYNSIAIVSTFAEFQDAAHRLGTNNLTQMTIQIRSDTLTFEGNVTVPFGTSLVIQAFSRPLDAYFAGGRTVELRDVSLMVMPNAQLTITDATIPNGAIDVADDSALITIHKSTIYHSVRIGNPTLTQGSLNTLIVVANPAPGEINIDHPLLLDEGKVFLNHSITLSQPLVFASKAKISVKPLGEVNFTCPSISGSSILLLDDVQIDLTEVTLAAGTSVQIGEHARLNLLRVVILSSTSTVLRGNGSLSISSSTIEFPGSSIECGVVNMTAGILNIYSSTFDADIPDACLPGIFEASGNVVRISNIEQLVQLTESPSLLLSRGYLLFVQSDTRETRLIPASQSDITSRVVTSTGVNNLVQFELNGLDMVQITATKDVCIQSFQLVRNGMVVLEIPISLFENCVGVCSSANPTCEWFPSFNYTKAQGCIRLGPRSGFNLNLKLNADSCERLVLNPLRIEALTNELSYQLLMDETLTVTNNSNTSIPILARPLRRLQLSGVNNTSICFKGLQIVSSGIASASIGVQDLNDCGLSCGRLTDQANGCVNLNYVRYELANAGADQCSRISVGTTDSCSQSTAGLTASDLDLLSRGLISVLRAELADESVVAISQIITLNPHQTLQISAVLQATVNASFIVNAGAQLVLQNLLIFGRIINLGGRVDLQNTIFYAAPVHSAAKGYLDGGSIFSSSAATVTANHVSFLQTQTPGNGGAIANTGRSQLTCNSCLFSINEAAGLGNSIFNSAGSVAVLESCTFDTESSLFNELNGQVQLSNVQLVSVASLVDARSKPVDWEIVPNTLEPLFTFPDGLCASEGPFPTPVITSLDQCQRQCRTNATCKALSYTYATQECAWCNFERCRFNCTSDTDVFEAAPRYSFFSIKKEGICLLNYTESSSLSNAVLPSVTTIDECQLWCGTYGQECAIFVFDETTSSCRLYRSVVFDTNCTTLGQPLPFTSSLSFPTTVNPTKYTLVGFGNFTSGSSLLVTFENITVSGRCEALCIAHRRCSGYALAGSSCSLFAGNAFTLIASGDPIFIRTTDEPFPKLIYDSSFSITSLGSESVDEFPAVTDEACQQLCDAALSGCFAYVFKIDKFRCIIVSQRPRDMALASGDVQGPYALRLAMQRLTFEPLTIPLMSSSLSNLTSNNSDDTTNGTEFNISDDTTNGTEFEVDLTRQNFTLCELPWLKLNKTLAPGECRTICFAHDMCDSLVYDFDTSACAFYASPSAECPGRVISVNVTFQTLFQLTTTSLVPSSHVVTACFKSRPLFPMRFNRTQSLEACRMICDLFSPECVGVSFDNGSCELLESVYVTSASNCSPSILAIALDSIQNSDSFLSLSSSYCLSGPRLARLPGITQKECEKHCSSTFRTCGSFAYSLSNGCQLFSGGSYEPCFNIAATLNLASPSLGFSSFISYDDPAFVQPSPDERPSEIIASTPINSTSWCIGLCTAYEECGAIRLSSNVTDCTLLSACGTDTYNCLSPQLDADFFRPLVCPKQVHSFEIVSALRLEFCMALCKGRAACQGFFFRVATKECEMLLTSFELDPSDDSSCDVRSFYLQGLRPMVHTYDALPLGILPQGSTLLNSTASSVESCLTEMCFKNGTRRASCSSFIFDLATGYCAVSYNQTLVLGRSTSPTFNGFMTRVFPFTIVKSVVITRFDLIRLFTGFDTVVEKCSLLCDAIPSCKSFALSVLPSALNVSVIDSAVNASCLLFRTTPEYSTSIPESFNVSVFDLYFRIPSSRFVSLGRSGKKLVAPQASAASFDSVGDSDYCLRLCEVVLGCKAVLRNPCILYPDSRYELDASLTQHPEIYISFASQAEYTLETQFLRLPNFASVPLPAEVYEIQTSFMSTPGSSRLVFRDGSLHPFNVQLGSQGDSFQLVNACMYNCVRTVSSKVIVKWNNRYKDRLVSEVGELFLYPSPPNICTKLSDDASQCGFFFRNPSSDCGGANCVSSCGSAQAFCQRDQTFTNYYCCSCKMLETSTYLCSSEGEPEFVDFEDYSVVATTQGPGCRPQVSVDATGGNSCTSPAVVTFGDVLNSPKQNVWGMSSLSSRLILVKIELQYDFDYYPSNASPWIDVPKYSAREFIRDTSRVRRGGYPMCLSSTTPTFIPFSANDKGQLWSDPKGFPVINEYMQECNLPEAQSSLNTYLTFQIFSASARLCLMLRPSLELAACSGDIRQQFYLDKDNTLRSASAPGSVIFSSVTWTRDGYIRINNARILFVQLDSTIITTAACPWPLTCPMLGHTVFVLPADYPETLAKQIRDAAALNSSYPILKASKSQTTPPRIENAFSLDSCQQFCGTDCGSVEFERNSNSCVIFTGASANIVQPSLAKEISVPFSSLPYQRVANVTYERPASFLWNTTVSHLAQCYSLCDELLACLSFSMDSNMTCRFYNVHPVNLTSFTNGTMPTFDESLKVFIHTRRFPQLTSFFGYPEREIVSLSGLSPDECSVLCLSMSECRLIEISNDAGGRLICRLNTRERTVRMQLQSRSTSSCASLPSPTERTVVPRTCNSSRLEFQYYYGDAMFRVADQSSRCLVRNLLNDTFSVGNCNFDLSAGGLDFRNEFPLFKLHNVSLNMFLSVGGNNSGDANFTRCLKDDTSAYRTTASCDPADSLLAFQSFNATPSMYFTRPDALVQEIEDPDLILQLFLLSPQGQPGVNVLIKLQNLERKAQSVQRRLEAATMRIEGIIEWMAYVLIPVGALTTTVAVLDDALKPIHAAINLAKKQKIVRAVLKKSGFDFFLDQTKLVFSNADILLRQVGGKVNKLMDPINILQGMVMVLAGLIAPFVSSEIFRQFVIITTRAYECADRQGETQTAEALLAVLDSNERAIQSVNALMEGVDSLIVRVLDKLDLLRTTFVSNILPALNKFEQELQPLKALFKRLDFVADLMNMTIICLPNISYEVVPQEIKTGTIFGNYNLSLPHLNMGGKSCIPLQFICDGNLGISIAAVILSFVPGLGAIISFVIKLIVNLIKAFLLSIPASLAYGGQFDYDEDKCMACMVFNNPGGRCYKLEDLDAYLDRAEKIVQEAFYPTFKFLFDSLDFAVQNTLGRFMPRMERIISGLSIPGFDLLDSIEAKLNEEVNIIEAQADATLDLLESTFANVTLLPEEWDLECYLGPELEARFEGMLTDPDSMLDEVAVAAATAAIVSRGRPAPFSPSSLIKRLVKTRILPAWSTTLLPTQIMPAIVKMIGVSSFNQALGKGSPRGDSASSTKRSRNQKTMFDRVTKRRKLDVSEFLVPLMGLAVKASSSTDSGSGRRLIANPAANFFLDVSFAVLTVQKKIPEPKSPNAPRKSDYRILIRVLSTGPNGPPFDSVCAVEATIPRDDNPDKDRDFVQLPLSKFPLPGGLGLVQDQRLTLEFTIAAVSKATFSKIPKNTCTGVENAYKITFCRGMKATCVDFFPRVEANGGPKIEKQDVAFDLILRPWTARSWGLQPAKTNLVLLTRGPYAVDGSGTLPPLDRLNQVPSLIEAAFTNITATADYLDDSGNFADLSQRERYPSKLFSLAFGKQMECTSSIVNGNPCGGTPAKYPDFFAWQQVNKAEFENQVSFLSQRYRELGVKLRDGQDLEIREMESISRFIPAVKNAVGLTGFDAGIVHFVLHENQLNKILGKSLKCDIPVSDACRIREMTSTFVHEFSHLYTYTEDYVYFSYEHRKAVEDYAAFTAFLPTHGETKLVLNGGTKVPLYQAPSQAAIAAPLLRYNADSIAMFAMYRAAPQEQVPSSPTGITPSPST